MARGPCKDQSTLIHHSVQVQLVEALETLANLSPSGPRPKWQGIHVFGIDIVLSLLMSWPY